MSMKKRLTLAAKSNVTLFDARMLNESIDFAGGISKEIFPAAAALLMEFPMLVLSCEPEMDAMWIRLSKYFRNCKLYAASHFDKHLSAIPCFFDTGIVLSDELRAWRIYGLAVVHPENGGVVIGARC